MSRFHSPSAFVFYGLFAFLIVATILAYALIRKGKVGGETAANLTDRIWAWWVMIGVLALVFTLGATAMTIFFALCSMAALREFATITHTRRTLRSDAMMRFVVRDAAGYSTWSELANSNHSWSTEFATFAGDERALSEADKQQINRRKEFAPTDNEILRCLLEDLGNDAQWKVRNYFSRL